MGLASTAGRAALKYAARKGRRTLVSNLNRRFRNLEVSGTRRAATVIQRAWKRRRLNPNAPSQVRRQIGMPVRSVGPMKNFLCTPPGNVTSLNTRTLYVLPLNDLTQGPNIDMRERGVANIRGYAVKFATQCLEPGTFTGTGVFVMNIAIISPKHQSIINTDGFFRDYRSSRDVDFSVALGSLEINNNPINTDKYHVLRHFPVSLSENNARKDAGSDKTIRFYCPMKRLVAFDDDVAASSEAKVFLVWWMDRVVAGAGATVATGIYNVCVDARTVFNDVKR